MIRRLDGIFQGDHETLFHGVGMRMSDIREYQVGDDVRHLDWNVSARTGTLHVRTFHEERELTAWFLVDVSASLAWGSVGPNKRAVARQAVGALAGLLVGHGDRIAAMFDAGCSDNLIRTLPPGGSRSHVIRLLDMLDAPPGATPNTASIEHANDRPEGGTQLVPMLERAHALIRRRSLVVLVSDFLAAPGWEDALRRLTHRHDVLCIQVIDPAEQQLPDAGMMTVEDSESGAQLWIDSSDPIIRSRYREIVNQRQSNLRQTCLLAGADLLEINTQEPLLRKLTGYLASRKRRRAMPSALRSTSTSTSASASAASIRP